MHSCREEYSYVYMKLAVTKGEKAMKKAEKEVLACLLIVLIGINFAGCNFSTDITSYVEYTMDLLTKGESKGYISLTKSTEEEAADTYEMFINIWMDTIIVDEISEELEDSFRQLFHKLFGKSRYEIKGLEKVKGEHSYIVTIEVEQIEGMFEGLKEELTEKIEEWMYGLSKEPSDKVFNETAYHMLLDLMNARLENITYHEPENITVEVSGSDGSYGITKEGYQIIRDALLSTKGLYNGNEI